VTVGFTGGAKEIEVSSCVKPLLHAPETALPLPDFDVDAPGPYDVGFSLSHQLLSRAWSDPALFPEEVRNYVRRIRKILAELEIPCELVNRPARGYSLVFRPDE
jgi:hypothetical protein